MRSSEQEADNVNFVLDSEVGTYEKDPAKIAQILKEWLSSASEELAAMSERARALGRPEALFRIVDDLAALAMTHDSTESDLERPSLVAA